MIRRFSLLTASLCISACGGGAGLDSTEQLEGEVRQSAPSTCVAVVKENCEQYTDHDNSTTYGGPCTEITASNLPVSTDRNCVVLNFIYKDSAGDHGFVLGCSDGGPSTVTVPVSSGPATYQFTGVTRGNAGNVKYTVFSSCSLP